MYWLSSFVGKFAILRRLLTMHCLRASGKPTGPTSSHARLSRGRHAMVVMYPTWNAQGDFKQMISTEVGVAAWLVVEMAAQHERFLCLAASVRDLSSPS